MMTIQNSVSGFASDYPELATLLGELYTALDNGLQTLATIGMRTVFDCASQKLGTDPNQSFTEKLKPDLNSALEKAE